MSRISNDIWKSGVGYFAAYTEDRPLMARVKRYKADKWRITAEYQRGGRIYARQYEIPAEQIRSARRMFGVAEKRENKRDYSDDTTLKDELYRGSKKKPETRTQSRESVRYTQYFEEIRDRSEIPADVEMVEKYCANYIGDGRCLFDRPCPYFQTPQRQRCKYYEENVLPIDHAAEIAYWQRRGWPEGKGDMLANCTAVNDGKECGRPFLRRDNGRFCAICERIRAEKSGEVGG